jgi:hypothetical protein
MYNLFSYKVHNGTVHYYDMSIQTLFLIQWQRIARVGWQNVVIRLAGAWCKDGGKKVAMHPTKLQAAAQSIMQDAATNCSLHAV